MLILGRGQHPGSRPARTAPARRNGIVRRVHSAAAASSHRSAAMSHSPSSTQVPPSWRDTRRFGASEHPQSLTCSGRIDCGRIDRLAARRQHVPIRLREPGGRMGSLPDGQGLPTLGQLPGGGAFPEQPAEFAHNLHEDARLTLQAVADLADRLPRRSVICDTAAQPLLVPQGGPPRGALARPGDVIRNIEDASAWLTLLNIEADPAYADLMNTMLDQLEVGMIKRQGKMRNRVGFIFVSSPNSVTPAHFDIEHSLLMQVSGSKTVSFGRFENDLARRHEVERYWDGSHGRIESLPPGASVLSADAGARGVHTAGCAALGAQRSCRLLVCHPHVLHGCHRARKHDRGV